MPLMVREQSRGTCGGARPQHTGLYPAGFYPDKPWPPAAVNGTPRENELTARRRRGPLADRMHARQGEMTMPIPQVNDRIKEAPVVVLRAVFAGIGQLLLTADKVRARAAEQVWIPDRPAGPGQASPPPSWSAATTKTAPATKAATTKPTPTAKATVITNPAAAGKGASTTKPAPGAKAAPTMKPA